MFDLICDLDEYYLTRTETILIKEIIDELSIIINNKHLIEFGSGSSIKTMIILNSIKNIKSYIPIDISEEHLNNSAEKIKKKFPTLKVFPICHDFTKGLNLFHILKDEPRVIFFPGSTIGNFSEDEVNKFVLKTADTLKPNGEIIIGYDLKKEKSIIEAAYNDKKGITREFNLNLLRRINYELNGNFNLEKFEHKAIFNEAKKNGILYFSTI